jgi:hypothetical protein
MRKAMQLLAVLGLAGSLRAVDNLFIGTWILDVAKSKASDSSILPKSETAKYALQGNGIKSSLDGVDSQGNAYHEEWPGKWDGEDYPFISDGIAFTSSATKIDSNTLIGVQKKDGEEVTTYRITVSEDGKTLTLTAKGKGARGGYI